MAYIKSRKHVASVTPYMASAAAATLLSLGSAAMAQTAGTTLKEVEVKASGQSDYKADVSANPKYTAPLVDVPQTIQVIREQTMREQGATTLTEALRNTPGAGAFYLGENGSTSTGDTIYMRGFDASSSIFVDGIRDISSISRDMFNIEQVEVVKGPAGTDTGRTSPVGYINLVSKKPRLDDFFLASVGAGTANFKRGSFDWNKKLDGFAGEGAAFRLNMVSQDAGVDGRDVIKNKRTLIAPSLALGLNTPTRIYIDYLHVDQNNIPDGGVPTTGLPGYSTPDVTRPYLANAARVNSSNFYGTTSDHDRVQADTFTLRVEHNLTPTTVIRNTTRASATSEDYLLTSFMSNAANLATPVAGDPSTWTVARSLPTNKDQVNKIYTNQTNLSSEFNTGSIGHTMNAGVELIREEQSTIGYLANNVSLNGVSSGSFPAANLYNPSANVTGYQRIASGVNTNGRTDTLGIYAFDTAKLNQQWQITGGVRADHYSTTYTAGTAVTTGTAPNVVQTGVTQSTLKNSDTLFTGKIGVVYKPAENGSIYAGFGTSAQPPGGANFALSAAANSAANANYQPQKAKTGEIGTKWDLLNKQLSVTAALFRTEVNNDIVLDSVSNQYYQTGKKRVQGVELGAAGNITDNWGMSAGYTLTDTKVLSGPSVLADGSSALAYTPRTAFTSWTTYKLPMGFTIGGGVRYTGKLLRGSDNVTNGTPAYVASYAVVDAMATYRVTKNFDIQLNIYNLFDKDYVGAINKSGFRYIPGIPRSGRITANFTF